MLETVVRAKQSLVSISKYGISPEMKEGEAKVIQFVNWSAITMLAITITWYYSVIASGIWALVPVTLLADAVFISVLILNRQGHVTLGKTLFLTYVIITTSVASIVLGHQMHWWVMIALVFGGLVFNHKDSNRRTIVTAICFALFVTLEILSANIDPLIRPDIDPELLSFSDRITNISMAAALAGLSIAMHNRYSNAEHNLGKTLEENERLLLSLLPQSIASELRERGKVVAKRHEDVSVLFADIVGFTPLASRIPPEELVAMLNMVFCSFDAIATRYHLEKIKTIGDAYMMAGGLPEAHPCHHHAMAEAALDMMLEVEQFSRSMGLTVQIRIGIHSGPAVAGVIGSTRFAYDLWGATVNTAARLESASRPGQILVSSHFKNSIQDSFVLGDSDERSLKGIGALLTHPLLRRRVVG